MARKSTARPAGDFIGHGLIVRMTTAAALIAVVTGTSVFAPRVLASADCESLAASLGPAITRARPAPRRAGPRRAPVSVNAHLQLADCYQGSGQAVRALDVLHTALHIVDDAPSNAATIAAIRGRMGQVYAALGDHQAAVDNLLVAIDAARAGGAEANGAAVADSNAVAALLNDLGTVYMATDQPLLALAAFADSQRLGAHEPALRITAAINLMRAMSESGSGSGEPARLREIAVEALDLEPTRAKASMLLSLAELSRQAGRDGPPDGAPTDLAYPLATAALELARELEDSRLLSYAYGELGAVYAVIGSPDRALAATRQAVLTAQASGAYEALYRWEWRAGQLLRDAGRHDEALRAYRSAIDTLAKTQLWLVSSRRGFQRDVLPLYQEYADVMLASAHTLPEQQRGAALAHVQVALEQLRVAEVRNYFENQCAVPEVFDERRAAPEGAVVLYPVLFADRTELLVSTPEGFHQFRIPAGLAEMGHEARMLRAALEDPAAGDAYLEHARQLHRWLIEPMEPLLRDAAPRTLVWVPDGPLRMIPPAVLHDGERFLVERYALATTPGLSLIGPPRGQADRRVLVNGIIAPVRGFSPLPFVAEELAAVGRTFPSRVYADESFVTATLAREIVEGGYSVVHMATHARFESDYRRSFLLAYDDMITMDQLEALLGGQRFAERPVDLLVLSACQTAAGDERAALGLAGVAVKAGARSALASLWFIHDESTARLVSEFYRQLAAPANDKADALRGAQLLLMNDERYRHPAHWAAFLMIGDWR